MRDALTQLMYRRYANLYQQSELPMSQTCMCWGFSCDDGWFALIDALSETMTAIDPECQAVQVKEKFGTLRFYFNGDHDVLNTAVGAAEFLSSRICERTGAPGDLMKTKSKSPLYATLSAEVIEESKASSGTANSFEPVGEVPPTKPGSEMPAEIVRIPVAAKRAFWSRTEAIAVLKRRHAHALAAGCVIDIPKGGFDLADAVISEITRGFRDEDPSGMAVPKISRIVWGDASGMSVKIDEASLPAAARHEIASMTEGWRQAKKPILETEIVKLRRALAGVCLFANNMSKRVDPATGRTGPVDDDGRLRI